MRKLIINAITNIAKRKLAQFHPRVIAVTGSVGKTSTRTAIALAMGAKYRVRSPYKNYNNEIGVPLAVLGEVSPGKDAWGWLKLWNRARKVNDMPEYMALEYGADRPGDIGKLVDIAIPDVAVITAISPVHVENYPNLQALIEEKASIGDRVSPEGLVLLNANDQFVKLMGGRYAAKVMTYGLEQGDVYATDIRLVTRHEESYDPGEVFATIACTVKVPGDQITLELVNCVSSTSVLVATAAMAVAHHEGVPLADAAKALRDGFRPVAGRLNPIPGIKGSLILDDTYNAAPASVTAGLEALAAFTPGEEWDRRIAVLGDMAELGSLSQAEHEEVGRQAAAVADLFIAVGPQMQFAAEAAIAAGMSRDKVERFANAVEAGRYLDSVLEKGDVVLVKGSQSMRMEKAVKDVMGEPLKAESLLVRQEAAWQKS